MTYDSYYILQLTNIEKSCFGTLSWIFAHKYVVTTIVIGRAVMKSKMTTACTNKNKFCILLPINTQHQGI